MGRTSIVRRQAVIFSRPITPCPATVPFCPVCRELCVYRYTALPSLRDPHEPRLSSPPPPPCLPPRHPTTGRARSNCRSIIPGRIYWWASRSWRNRLMTLRGAATTFRIIARLLVNPLSNSSQRPLVCGFFSRFVPGICVAH